LPGGPIAIPERVREPATLRVRAMAAYELWAGPLRTLPNTKLSLRVRNGARTGVPPGIPEGAICVQRFDDSLNSAIHITYRISLRSSSMPEPRDPLLKVFRSIFKKIPRTEPFKGFLRVFRQVTLPKQKSKSPEGPAKDGRHPLFYGGSRSIMILPQVHLRKPCYDFYFL
jgi:hypothetical protein